MTCRERDKLRFSCGRDRSTHLGRALSLRFMTYEVNLGEIIETQRWAQTRTTPKIEQFKLTFTVKCVAWTFSPFRGEYQSRSDRCNSITRFFLMN